MSPLTVALLALLVPMVLIALANLAFAPRLHRVPAARPGTPVSVLVPARDEAENLARLLPALAETRHEPVEFLVLDDGSTDGTAELVRQHAAEDPRFRLIPGIEPPPGWTGKNWACRQLAYHAGGDLLVFCDADVVPGPDAVGRTTTVLERDTDVATAFPRHERSGWFQSAVIPLVAQLPVAALLPLPLVRATRAASLAVGNGQWLAWHRDAYRAIGGHARVRDEVLEDVRLARIAKAAGLRLSPFVATRDLTVRMYRDRAATWEGFAKNLYLLAGGTDAAALLALALFSAAMAAPLLLPFTGTAWSWAPLVALLALRVAAAALFRQDPRSVLLHPVGVPLVATLLVASRRRHRTGSAAWKRRTLNLERTA